MPILRGGHSGCRHRLQALWTGSPGARQPAAQQDPAQATKKNAGCLRWFLAVVVVFAVLAFVGIWLTPTEKEAATGGRDSVALTVPAATPVGINCTVPEVKVGFKAGSTAHVPGGVPMVNVTFYSSADADASGDRAAEVWQGRVGRLSPQRRKCCSPRGSGTATTPVGLNWKTGPRQWSCGPRRAT